MGLLFPLILGVVQGLTEFLPISSSGHLVFFQYLLGMREPELLLDVSLHVGTLCAVFIVFWPDIRGMVLVLAGLIRKGPLSLFSKDPQARLKPSSRILALILAGSIPTALIGILFRPVIEGLFASPQAAGGALLVTGAVLWLTRGLGPGSKEPGTTGILEALLIGVAQGMALVPGISRSGMTIAAGLFLGMEREWSARFSFLLSIPAITGAMILQLKDMGTSSFSLSSIIVGSLTALITGYLALRLLVRLVKKGRLSLFAPYCWVIGLLVLFLSLG